MNATTGRQHPNAPQTPEGRRRMVACVVDQGWTITTTAERFQVDAKTVRKWTDRFLSEGDAVIYAWPPVVPSVVVTECTTGQSRDANTNALLKRCNIVEDVPVVLARQAGVLRFRAQRDSAIDALVVAVASSFPDSVIVSSDPADLTALAEGTPTVAIRRV